MVMHLDEADVRVVLRWDELISSMETALAIPAGNRGADRCDGRPAHHRNAHSRCLCRGD